MRKMWYGGRTTVGWEKGKFKICIDFLLIHMHELLFWYFRTMANSLLSISSALPTNQTLPEPEFVDTTNPPICVNCEHTLRPPVFQTECGHRLCAKCADSLFQNNEHVMCPGKEEDCVKLTPAQVGIRVFNAFLLFFICVISK